MRRFNAFTLVELLVVIAIIAILIAILMPALGKAREQARLTQCMSGARQVYLAVDMYCNDNRGFYPFGFVGTDAYPFLPNRVWHDQLVELKYLNQWTQTNRGGCPHGPDAFNPSRPSDYVTSPETPTVSYGLNPFLQSGFSYRNQSPFYDYWTRWKRTDGLIRKRGSQVGLVFCSHVPYNLYDVSNIPIYYAAVQLLGLPDPYLYPTNPAPHRHKGKGLPVACADGHIDFMPKVEVTTYPPQPSLGNGIMYYSLWGPLFNAQ